MIVVAGEALVDLVVSDATAAGGLIAAPGGAAYNVARTLARLEAPSALLAALSTDGFGRRLAAGLADAGADAALLQRTEQPTTLAVATLDATGSATYSFYAEGTSAFTLAPVPLPDATTALVVGGLVLAIRPDVVRTLVTGAAPDVLVAVDVNCRPSVIADEAAYLRDVASVVTRADVVKVSVEDLAVLSPGAAVDEAAGLLLGAGGTAVLVTDGERPTRIVTATGRVEVPVAGVPGPVVDTVGAGDAFVAGFLAWWRETGAGRGELADLAALRQAVEAASTVAAAVVARRGADPPARAGLPHPWRSR